MEIKIVKTADIMPYFNNPRNNAAAVGPTMESIKKYGFQKPILLDKDGIIIAGHTRHQAAVRLGLEEVPVIYLDLDDEHVKIYRLIDNKIAEKSEYDNDELLDELKKLGAPLEMQSFFFEDLESLLSFNLDSFGAGNTDMHSFELDDDTFNAPKYDDYSSDSDDDDSEEEDEFGKDGEEEQTKEPEHRMFYPYRGEDGKRYMDVFCPYCKTKETIELDD